MPSNAMKLSQLISKLINLKAEHGDLDCVLCVPSMGAAIAIDGRNINVARELPTGSLPAPACVFGLWQDERGRLQTSPGQVYQADPESNGWNYIREIMPENTPVEVHKRYGGKDIGLRRGVDFYVMEGGDREIQIVPEGVLAWRALP